MVKVIKRVDEIKPKVSKKPDVNHLLIENFVNLQRVMTNLSIKFDNLSDQISKLLQLFEISAKAFTEKELGRGSLDREKDKELVDKLNVLLDQNKTIAKGLTLMEQRVRERAQTTYSSAPIPVQRPQFNPSQFNLSPARVQSQIQQPMQNSMQGMQPSMQQSPQPNPPKKLFSM